MIITNEDVIVGMVFCGGSSGSDIVVVIELFLSCFFIFYIIEEFEKTHITDTLEKYYFLPNFSIITPLYFKGNKVLCNINLFLILNLIFIIKIIVSYQTFFKNVI